MIIVYAVMLLAICIASWRYVSLLDRSMKDNPNYKGNDLFNNDEDDE